MAAGEVGSCPRRILGTKPSFSGNPISGGVDERGHHYLSLDGSIALGDPKNLPLLANARSYQLDALRLNSPGGSNWQTMTIAVMMGRAVRYQARALPPCMTSKQYD